jgi:hypothetical protein
VDNRDFIGLLAEIFGEEPWPKPLHLIQGARAVQRGEF